jgi:cellulose synthase/poly-beta-1,6-N-acetylglucosamine synthase-like glycosyltransferase
MNQTHSFTYVIGYRHQIDRLNNLRRVLDWINGFMGVEVLLIEQDTHSKISHMGLRCKHVFLKSNKPYNKSWSFNYATKIAKSNIIVFADSDLLMDPNHFIESLKHLEQFEMVNPYNSVIDLDPQESSTQFEDVIKINRPGRGETDHQKVPICGGICMFRKDAIQRIGGWNENFIGWGGEDDFVSIKVQHFLNWKQMEAKCYHLFHSRPQPDMNLYQKNLQLHNTYLNMTKEELSKQLYKDVARNGLKNKYDTF